MTRPSPVPSRRPRPPARAVAVALAGVLAVAAAAGGCAQTDEGAPPTTVAVAGTPVPSTAGPGTVTTADRSAPAPAQATLPEALKAVTDVSGGDAVEATCINAEVVRGLQGQGMAGLAGARNQIVGAAVATCLPPAKAAAAVAGRIRAGALATPLDGPAVDCIRATLVDGVGDPAYAPFVGAVVAGDAQGARQNAAAVDAACGTTFAAGG